MEWVGLVTRVTYTRLDQWSGFEEIRLEERSGCTGVDWIPSVGCMQYTYGVKGGGWGVHILRMSGVYELHIWYKWGVCSTHMVSRGGIEKYTGCV